jgi:hypothetical protein
MGIAHADNSIETDFEPAGASSVTGPRAGAVGTVGAAGQRSVPPTLAKRRSLRVTLLLVACIAMSLLDLELTLMYAREIGMVEANPIARLVMAHQSPALVVLFKFASLGLACGILYRLRHHPRAELGAWVCFVVLVWLSLRWLDFAVSISDYTRAYAQQAVYDPTTWVKFDDVE